LRDALRVVASLVAAGGVLLLAVADRCRHEQGGLDDRGLTA
jgi:hypothetical protein